MHENAAAMNRQMDAYCNWCYFWLFWKVPVSLLHLSDISILCLWTYKKLGTIPNIYVASVFEEVGMF